MSKFAFQRAIDLIGKHVYKYRTLTERCESVKTLMFSRRADCGITSQRLIASLLLAFTCFICGCIKRDFPRSPTAKQSAAPTADYLKAAERININTARATELETLPGIGKALAARIIEHREKYGPFRRVEHLIIVRGISDNRFRALRESITVE